MLARLHEIETSIADLCIAHRVKSLAVFGSATGDAFSSNSDVDFLVEFQEPISAADYASAYFSLQNELELLLQRPVDLVTHRSLTNPYFQASVMSERVQLYAA